MLQREKKLNWSSFASQGAFVLKGGPATQLDFTWTNLSILFNCVLNLRIPDRWSNILHNTHSNFAKSRSCVFLQFLFILVQKFSILR